MVPSVYLNMRLLLRLVFHMFSIPIFRRFCKIRRLPARKERKFVFYEQVFKSCADFKVVFLETMDKDLM